MTHEQAISKIEESGLEIWHASSPKNYRVKHPDMHRSIRVRSMDLRAFAQIIQKQQPKEVKR